MEIERNESEDQPFLITRRGYRNVSAKKLLLGLTFAIVVVTGCVYTMTAPAVTETELVAQTNDHLVETCNDIGNSCLK